MKVRVWIWKHLTWKSLILFRVNSATGFWKLTCLSSKFCMLVYSIELLSWQGRITTSLLFSQFNYQKYQWRSSRCWNYYCEKHWLIRASWCAFEWKHSHEFRRVFEMLLEVQSSFSHHILAAERGRNWNFDSHKRSKLLQCGEDTHTL